MPNKSARPSSSTKSKKKTTQVNTTTSAKVKSPQKKAPLWTVYLDISELPLEKFIACAVDDDYTALIKKGKPNKYFLKKAWTVILEQYQTAIGDSEHKEFLSALRAVHLYDLHIKSIELCVAQLRLAPTEYFIKELQAIDRPFCRVKLDWSDQVSYQAALDKCLARVKGNRMDLKIKKMHFEALLKKKNAAGKEKTKMERKDYISNLITLSAEGFPIQIKDITTFEFCERLRRHTIMVEAQMRRKFK